MNGNNFQGNGQANGVAHEDSSDEEIPQFEEPGQGDAAVPQNVPDNQADFEAEFQAFLQQHEEHEPQSK